VHRELLSSTGCSLFNDRATFVDPHTLRIGRSTPGLREHAFTSNDVFEFEEMSRCVLIVGGGYIGVEFAGIFKGLGAKLTLVCHSASLLGLRSGYRPPSRRGDKQRRCLRPPHDRRHQHRQARQRLARRIERRDLRRSRLRHVRELAGVVTALGYGTTGLSVGQRVFGLTDWTRAGTLAEYAAVEAS
jgi:hypothetical protein